LDTLLNNVIKLSFAHGLASANLLHGFNTEILCTVLPPHHSI